MSAASSPNFRQGVWIASYSMLSGRGLSSYMVILASNLVIRMAAKRRDWQAQVKGLLKAELKRRNLSYADLADKLGAVGVKDSERNISNKISRLVVHPVNSLRLFAPPGR